MNNGERESRTSRLSSSWDATSENTLRVGVRFFKRFALVGGYSYRERNHCMSWRIVWLRFTWSICVGSLLMTAEQRVCAGQGESMPRRTLAPVRVNPVLLHPQERRISLAGQWSFRLDPQDQGVKEQWFDDRGTLADKIGVPGCWQGQGFGGDGKDQLFEDRGPVRTFRATYTGTGWYGKHFHAPAEWKRSRIWLNFGGVHPSAEIWLNGVRLGENHLPFVPFGFEVTDVLRFDKENWLAVRVHEKDRDLGLLYNWQGNWSGLYRGVELTATGRQFIEDFRTNPDPVRQVLRFRVRIGDLQRSGKPLILRLSAQAIGGSGTPAYGETQVASDIVEYDLAVPSPRLWNPEKPQLYRVDGVLSDGKTTWDALSERVGFVRLATEHKHFLINGSPYFLRGHGDFCDSPETGSPDTDRARWLKKLTALRKYGYNYVRCNSYVYNPEYFDAADEAGVLVQSEMGTLCAYIGTRPDTPENRQALDRQWNLIVMRDANHPSAGLYSMSNELNYPTSLPAYAERAWQCYRATKAIKPGALVIWTAGGWNEDLPGDFVDAEAEYDAKCSRPLIQHEWRWWSSYPDVRIMCKYSGAVRPYAAEIAQQAASRQGLAHLLPQFAANSQRLQVLEAKAKMEMRRRDFPHLAGISQYSAADLNPSPQGILDEFYDRKYVDGATWLQTNGDTVILSSLQLDDRALSAGSTRQCRFFVSDFSHPAMTAPKVTWRLVAGDETLASGQLSYAHRPYCTCPAGVIEIAVPAVSHARAARLEASLREGDRTVTNSWNVWLFPAKAPLPPMLRYDKPQRTWLRGWAEIPPASPEEVDHGQHGGRDVVVLTERLDERLVAFMRGGGRVILAAQSGLVRTHGPMLGSNELLLHPASQFSAL